MSIKRTTPIEVIEGYLSAELQRRQIVLINLFCYVGEACIVEARTNGAYIDRTGNLRSSIGYAVLQGGKVVQSGGLEKVGSGASGMSEGAQHLNELIRQNREGIVLIMSAGMNYSAAVEAKNINVLTSAELVAKKMVPSILKQLGFKKT